MTGKKAAKPVNQAAAAAEKQGDGSAIYLDPDLAKVRDEEMAKLEQVAVQPREPATIDPALEALRDAEMKRGPREI
jgi:hypothetical protein